jgi:LPXTG-motif cell wall-anchored protein
VEQKKKTKIIIIILAVLLGLSLLALAGTVIYNKLAGSKPATVTVPDNLITPDEDKTGTDGNDTGEPDNTDGNDTKEPDNTGDGTASTPSDTSKPTQAATDAKKAATISLYDKQPEENKPFHVENMFPGDVETKYFRIQVSYHDKVTVHYHADIRPGYEKLAEVLKVKIRLLSTGETMYDGLMRDMPESVTYKLASAKSTTEELYYEITAYLDTSVGNEYQNKDLIADFRWWVEETGNLGPSPKTGDSTNIVVWALLAFCTGSILIFLLVTRRRKEDEENG